MQMCNDNTDDMEMAKQLSNMYSRGNALVRNFKGC